MKKIFLAIIIIISSNLKSQNTNLLNLPKYDKQWYHFGFTLGLMNTNLKIDYQQNQSVKNISAISSAGTLGGKDYFKTGFSGGGWGWGS